MTKAFERLPRDRESTDFYEIEALLDDADREKLHDLRSFLEKEVEPKINHYWSRAEFPFEILPGLRELEVVAPSHDTHGFPGRSHLFSGMVIMEIARFDPSLATFMGVHGGLALGSVSVCGSEEQQDRWLPPMRTMELLGSFGLTEPDVGSGVAGGLTTTCRREGDEWVLNGQKKWIGNATFADLNVIWALDTDDNAVKGFVVEKDTPGFVAEKMEDKIALRVVQNACISLDDVRVPEANRLQNANSFADTAKVLRGTRASVAWMAVGCAKGAYEHALAYAKDREQFGRPIGGFQLVQDLLVRMLSNIISSQSQLVLLSQLQDKGRMTDEQASLAKASTTVAMRETVGLARELLGGNGVLLENHVGRFVADAEAIYSYEGTREINSLIVGRGITGLGAFV
jgi:glutaryl-CoA dehydrogenase